MGGRRYRDGSSAIESLTLKCPRFSGRPSSGMVFHSWRLQPTPPGRFGSAAGGISGFRYGAVGTDTGGSVSLPASYWGAGALKPAYGLVSTRGFFPSWSGSS